MSPETHLTMGNGSPEAQPGARDLSSVLALSEEQIAGYRRDGYIVLRSAVAREEILPFRPWIAEQWSHHKLDKRAMAERDAYGQAFTQALNLGQHDPRIEGLSRARRFGRLAADLMGVRGVRVFLDEAFFKEPGSGPTPWHQDQSTFPFDAEQAMTLWIPLMDIGPEMGLLSFAAGSQHEGQYGPPDISEDTERAVGQRVTERGYPVFTCEHMAVGDVSAHAGWTMHRAGRNVTATQREVYSIHYFADGARVTPPDNPSRKRILEFLSPGLKAGDLAASPNWPLVYERE